MGGARGQKLGLCKLSYLVAYHSYVFEWMELSGARFILFHTSLHYIDTAAYLRSR